MDTPRRPGWRGGRAARRPREQLLGPEEPRGGSEVPDKGACGPRSPVPLPGRRARLPGARTLGRLRGRTGGGGAPGAGAPGPGPQGAGAGRVEGGPVPAAPTPGAAASSRGARAARSPSRARNAALAARRSCPGPGPGPRITFASTPRAAAPFPPAPARAAGAVRPGPGGCGGAGSGGRAAAGPSPRRAGGRGRGAEAGPPASRRGAAKLSEKFAAGGGGAEQPALLPPRRSLGRGAEPGTSGVRRGGGGAGAPPANRTRWVGPPSALPPRLGARGGREPRGLRARRAEGGGGWRPGSGSVSARPRRGSHDRGARPGGAGPAEVLAAAAAVLELGGVPATGTARGWGWLAPNFVPRGVTLWVPRHRTPPPAAPGEGAGGDGSDGAGRGALTHPSGRNPAQRLAAGFQDGNALGVAGLGSRDLSEDRAPGPRAFPMPRRAAPRAGFEDPAARPSPRGAAWASASAVSSSPDPAAPGDDAGGPVARTPGGEGEPRGRHRDARLGSGDKEPKAGAAAADSAPTAPPGSPAPPEPRVEAMDEAGGPGNLLPKPCSVLVLLNPYGGKGKGLQLFRSLVQPQLARADISFRLMLTERRKHAQELMRTEELGPWDALVVMSGDGLMHEVVNGLMERPDWVTAIRKPLCSLPSGSGNALAASLNHYAGYEQVANEELLNNCTLMLCRRRLTPASLLSLQMGSGQRIFSVLSLAWGFIADVDIESEKFRRLGKMRFTMGTLLRLAALRVYRGQLAYLPAERGASAVPSSPELAREAQQGFVDTHLVPLEQPVPAHWTVVPEQDFVLVLVMMHSHLGSEMFVAPMDLPAAGAMHLFYVRAGASRAMMLRLFLAMEKGRHMECDCPYLVYVPVVAFRLQPKGGKGMFTVDGELMVSEAVQGQVHPNYLWMVSEPSSPPEPQPPPPRQQPPQTPSP